MNRQKEEVDNKEEEEDASFFYSSFPGGPDHCPPQKERNVRWNWTRAGEEAIRPCPAGATGLARYFLKNVFQGKSCGLI